VEVISFSELKKYIQKLVGLNSFLISSLLYYFKINDPNSIDDTLSTDFGHHGCWHGEHFYAIMTSKKSPQLPLMLMILDLPAKKWSKIPWILGSVNLLKENILCLVSNGGFLTSIGKQEERFLNNEHFVYRAMLG
jgi:hypothetical protein